MAECLFSRICGLRLSCPIGISRHPPLFDANKRTALNTVVVFYFLNGYRFEYDSKMKRPPIPKKRLRISEPTLKNWVWLARLRNGETIS